MTFEQRFELVTGASYLDIWEIIPVSQQSAKGLADLNSKEVSLAGMKWAKKRLEGNEFKEVKIA